MRDRATRLFLRWRDHGQVDALAKLFDRVAPELLRLGSHLAGDVAAAEDLLQEAFLTAIEQAERFDGSRPVTPWLAGILTNRARSERRRSERAPRLDADGDRIPVQGAEPAAAAADRELSDVARRAIEQLREPFREPTMLRLVHGMEPAEIALVLDRSPATVRTQIHRGLEIARRALPTGIATALLATAMTATRGLAAIRGEILAAGTQATVAKFAAGATAATASTTAAAGAGLNAPTFTLWGLAMSKQTALLTAVAAVCATILGVSFWPGDDGRPVDASADDPVAPAMVHSDAGKVPNAATPGPAPERVDRVAAATPNAASIDPAWTLQVRVLDGPTNRPLPATELAMFGPRTLTLLELQRELASVTRLGPTGIPHSPFESVRIPDQLPLDVTVHGGSHPFLLPPGSGDAALAHQITDENGCCTLPIPASGVVLATHRQGYADRQLAIDGTATAKQPQRLDGLEIDSETGDGTLDVRVWPVRELVGFVQTDRCETPPEPLDLLLEGNGGRWQATTDHRGRFLAQVGAERVHVRCLTPGWTITQRITKPNGQEWITPTSLQLGEQGTVHVARYGGARIHVVDAETRDPIETVLVQSLDDNGTPRHAGTFFAAGGWLDLAPFDPRSVLEMPIKHRGVFPSRLTVTIWADGYLPRKLERIELFGAKLAPHEIALERGELARYAGRVTRGEDPVAGASVRLRPFNRLNWQRDTEYAIAAARTAKDGTFDLAPPPGDYLCEVFVDGTRETQFAVTVNPEEQLDRSIDLGAAIYVEVLVVDAKERPQPNHNVAARGPGFQGHNARTNEDGRIRLGPFDAGKLQVFAPLQPTEGSWAGAVKEHLEVAHGERPVVVLRLPADRRVRCFVAFADSALPAGFDGFRAKASGIHGTSTEPVELEADGGVPIDLVPGTNLHISAPDGRKWDLDLPEDAQPGHVFTLRWGGLALAGTVTVAGQPLVNGRVFLHSRGGSGQSISVPTDAKGSFRAGGLEARTHWLAFHTDKGARFSHSGNNPFEGQRFVTETLPSTEPTRLTIELLQFRDGRYPGRDEISVRGRVVDANGNPIAGAVVGGRTLLPQTGGTLQLSALNGWNSTGADGAYRLVLPRGVEYRLGMSAGLGKKFQEQPLVIAPNQTRIERDVVLR